MEDELFKKTEEILSNYKPLKGEVENLKIHIEETNIEYKGCSAITYEEKIGSSNKFNSIVENEVLHKEKQIEKLQYELDKRVRLIKKVDNALETLTEREHSIIELKYFSQIKSWDVIGTRLELCGGYCCALNRSIIGKLSRIIFVGEYVENL